ncbi:putative ANTH domain, ENTH domain, ANTH domain superfamily protein [Dioscorea sansibarensis]
MGSLPSFRKAYGVLKDSTKVGLAKVNSDFKVLDVAIVKATSHVECPPSERHVRKIIAVIMNGQPRVDVAYCIHALARRLAKTRNWIVALKTLILIHRILRECDRTFKEELISYSQREPVLLISNFKDDSSQRASDCSSWVRAYGLFLYERLECFQALKYDIEAEGLSRTLQGSAKGLFQKPVLKCEELIEQLPALQLLLSRLVGCQPEGVALGNSLIQYAVALVLKESFKIYCAMNEGIIDLVDMFFDMPKHNAVMAYNIYRRAGQLAQNLSSFYDFCKGLDIARTFQFPILREPPTSFIETMEEYISEAPQAGFLLPNERRLLLTYKQADDSLANDMDSNSGDDINELEEAKEAAKPTDVGDLLQFDEEDFVATELKEGNELALMVISQGEDCQSSEHHGLVEGEADPSGWELALITYAINSSYCSTENEMASEIGKSWLENLYNQEEDKGHQNGGLIAHDKTYTNPFESPDPFYTFNSIASQNDEMPMTMQTYQRYLPESPIRSTNPFDDEFFFISQRNHL